MKNIQRIIVVFALGICFLQTACTSMTDQNSSRNQYYNSSNDNREQRPLVDDKYSLAQDRKEMEELRAQIPEQRKRDNDELALMLKLTENVGQQPSDIRNKFDQLVRKRREQFDKDIQRERDQYGKIERKERDQFLKEQDRKRAEFNKEKHKREEKDEFYRDSEQRRSQFFADSREKRDDFEADIRERRKNFEDYMREKNNAFNQEMRSYTERYNAWKKEQQNNNQ